MEKKVRKLYEKAMNFYEQGKIDKALDICELALSKELNNSLIINFKGMLLYQKGRLNEALIVWKLNEELNKDVVASNYIKDAQNDFERLELYKRAEDALKKLNIELALELLSRCALSDFNSIKVNKGLAVCYQKKGDYEKAFDYIEKALKVDCNYKEALKIKKELIDFGGNKLKKKSSKKLMFITILFFVIIIICICIAIFMKNNYKNLFNYSYENLFNHKKNTDLTINNNDKEENKLDKQNSNSVKEDKKEQIADKETNKIEEINNDKNENENNIKVFDNEKLESAISNRNIDSLVDQLLGIKEQDINSENKYLYRQAMDLINSEGIVTYYNKGVEYYNQKNYEKAEIELNKAYDFCENNPYKEHILFYRASNSSQMLKNDLAMKQYEEYYQNYPNGVYIEGVLYELAILTISIDKEKSKIYANELINNFPKSIYINDYIVNILNN